MARAHDRSITTGYQNTLIGTATDTSAVGSVNQTVIGYDAVGVANNSVTLGDGNVTAVYMADNSGATVYAAHANLKSTATSGSGAGGILTLAQDDGTLSASGEQLGRINFEGAEDGSNTMD